MGHFFTLIITLLYPHKIKRNDICTTILWQSFNNFISHTHIILLFSLFLFLSPLILTNKKREKRSCHINCITWLFKYHYSKINSHKHNLQSHTCIMGTSNKNCSMFIITMYYFEKQNHYKVWLHAREGVSLVWDTGRKTVNIKEMEEVFKRRIRRKSNAHV